MVEFVKALPSTIDAASKNPLALIALLILIASWVIVSLKVYRNRELLKSLGRLPQKDRLRRCKPNTGLSRLKGACQRSNGSNSNLTLTSSTGLECSAW